MKPSRLQIRAATVGHLCRACQTPCALQSDLAAHVDPCAACPLSPPKWGKFDCPAVALVTAAPVAAAPATVPTTAPSVGGTWSMLLRTLRGWRRAGLSWAGRARRREILPICRTCEHHRIDPRTGLVACAAGCNCGAAAVSVTRKEAGCKLGRWP